MPDTSGATDPAGTEPEVTYRVADRIATITLNRPAARNGYTVRMADELAAALDRADHDPDVRVAVLTGAGRDFCVGADLSQGGFDPGSDPGPGSGSGSGPSSGPGSDNATDTAAATATDPGAAWQEPAGRCSRRIFTMNKPVIAALNGNAIGGGITITLSADYRLAATDSRFGFVFTRRGIYPEGASAWFLPRLVGMGRALDWMISGRLVDAAEAERAGLVHSVHAPDELLDAAYALAAELVATTAPVSVAVTRQLLYRMSPLDSPAPVHELDSKLVAGIADSPDAVEGVLSFLQKRPPEFTLSPETDLPEFLPWSQS